MFVLFCAFVRALCLTFLRMIQRIGKVLLVVACLLALLAQKPAPNNSAEAARLNNLGLAYMNQQLPSLYVRFVSTIWVDRIEIKDF